MCAGAQYSGTFQNCTFQASAVYAVHGAAATLRGCTIHGSRIAITLSGDATLATLTDCTFDGCHTGIVTERGAAVAAKDCLLEHAEAGVVVNCPGTRAVLENCTVRGGLVRPFGGRGVSGCHGSIHLRTCRISRFIWAVVGSCDTTRIEAHQLQVAECMCGILLTSRARCLVRESTVRTDLRLGDNYIAAVTLCAEKGGEGGARMQLERSTVHSDTLCGLITENASGLAAKLCQFDCSEEVARSGSKGGQVSLSHCHGKSQQSCCLWAGTATARLRLTGGRYEGGATACALDSSARLTAVDCELCSRCEPSGIGVVSVGAGVRAWLLRCHVHHGTIAVSALEATVHASDVVVSDVRAVVPYEEGAPRTGVARCSHLGGAGFSCMGGRMVIKGGKVQRCVVGVEAKGNGGRAASIAIRGVAFSDCVVGVDSLSGSAADVTRCEFRSLKREAWGGPQDRAALIDASYKLFPDATDVGVAIRGSDCSSVEHCMVEGFSVGISARSAAGVGVHHCGVTVTRADGVCILASAKVTIEDCSCRGAQGVLVDGVQVLEGAECSIRRCHFRALNSSAVMAYGHGCSVKVMDSEVQSCACAVTVSKQAEAAIQDCEVRGSWIGMRVHGCGSALSAKRVTVVAQQFGVHLPFSAGPGSPAVVKLVDSVFSGGTTGVCVGDAVAEVSVVRCRIFDTLTGMLLCGPSVGRMKASSVTGCKSGVVVGEVLKGFDPELCTACGRTGAAAVRHAYEALLGSGGVSPPGARCAHDGAIAKMSMADVEVTRCEHYGVLVNANGFLDARGVTVQSCWTGYVRYVVAKRSVYQNCKAIACTSPAVEFHRLSADVSEEPGGTPIPEIEVFRRMQGT